MSFEHGSSESACKSAFRPTLIASIGHTTAVAHRLVASWRQWLKFKAVVGSIPNGYLSTGIQLALF